MISQVIGTLNSKFGITDAEPGWFPEDWDTKILEQVLYALATTPPADESQPIVNHCGNISITGYPGHIVVSVMPPRGAATMVYFHNRS